MRDPRMSRRASQATPRMSLVWTSINLENKVITTLGANGEEQANMADGEQDGIKQRGSLRDFCCNHVKSIATIVMMFGMVFTVVMIVMVHKWNYEKNEAKYVSACHDIAIIGAGISGTYTAWKMRHLDKDIRVFEMSDRVGGMFNTEYNLTEFPDLYLELGVTSYDPEQQPLLHRTIHAVQPSLNTSRPQSHAQPTYFFRSRHLTTNNIEFSSNGPYNMEWAEKFKTPQKLQKFLVKKALGNETTTSRAMLHTVLNGSQLYQQGYQHVISRVGSQEAVNFLSDSAPWPHLTVNENAALLLSENLRNMKTNELSIDGGMQKLPRSLLHEFLHEPNSRHMFSPMRRLACIIDKHGVYHMIFIKTYRKDGVMKDHRDSEEVCAHKVVLAIPPNALNALEWTPFEEMPDLREILDSVRSYPVLRVFFIYSEAFWPNIDASGENEPPYTNVYTDLPIRHFKFIGTHYSKSRVRHYVFMTAEVDADALPYLQDLLHMRAFDGQNVYYCNKTERLIKEISRHIATVFNKPVSEIPEPYKVLIQDWSEDQSTGNWFVWRRGALWKKIYKSILKPVDDEDVYVVGNGFAEGEEQLNVDGAIKSVDDLIENYFQSKDN